MIQAMRTTVTLESDVEQIIRRRMRESGMSFKEALNDAIRRSVTATATPFHTKTASMGRSTVNLDRALQVVSELEDDELIRKARAGS